MNRYFFFLLVISYVFAASYSATINDLSNNFANVNSGAFFVNDSVVVSTTGHNLVQITSKSCTASFVSGGLQCCDVTTYNNCGCTNSQFTITFSTNGTYYFKCDVTNHCGFGYIGQITFNNLPTPTSSSHHNSTNTTSSHHTSSSHHNSTNTTSSHHNTTSSHHTSSSHKGGATYSATIFDLQTNFSKINGGVFHVNDRIIVSTAGGHNIAQIASYLCSSSFVANGLQCCNVTTNNNCGCPNNSYTLTFSNVGTYFFECAVSGHCSSLGLLGQLTIVNTPNNGTSSHASGAERLTFGFGLLFVASFIVIVKFFKMI